MLKIKNFLIIILCLGLFASIVSCNKKQIETPGNSQVSKKFTIVTSFYPMYIFTKNITKNVKDIEVVNMTERQTGCLHDYQLSMADMKALENANVFVINGAGMEAFMDKVTKQMTNLKIVEASKGIELLKTGQGNEGNPHIWVGISGAIQQVKNITEQLALIDLKNAEKYKKNGEEYVNKLITLKNKMVTSLKDVKNRDVITFHEAFPYFAKEFNLNVLGVIEKEPGQEPSAEELSNIIKIVKEKKIKALFTEEQYSPKSADIIAKETDAKVYQLDLVVTGSKDADTDSYIRAMEKNLNVLLEALK